MAKLVVCVMGQDCQKFIGMALDSVKDADAIVYCDGGSSDNSKELVVNLPITIGQSVAVIENPYDQEDPEMNGRQRNFYLDYLKENFPNHWALCIDADEVVEDLSKIKEMINKIKPEAEDILFSVKMRHLVGDLAHEDSTRPEHFVPHRLFKIRENLIYPESEHPVLGAKGEARGANTNITTIWHLAYCPNMWEIKKRYENHMKKSNMHTPEYLKSWYFAHLFGTYPSAAFNPVELPDIILDKFGIDKDELYFKDRGIEMKHALMVRQWYEFFKPTSVLDIGCGVGPYAYFWKWFTVCRGIEKSKFAVENALTTDIKQGDITKRKDMEILHSDLREYGNVHSLITAIDVLEHLEYDDLNKAIYNIVEFSEKILVSIPYKGTPNCENDPTHIIKESREWWVEQFTVKGLKEVEVPEHFLFKEQLLIFEK